MTRRRQLRVPEFVGSWPVVRSPSGGWCTLADLRCCSRPLVGRLMFFEVQGEEPAPDYNEVLKRGRGALVGQYATASERASLLAWVKGLGRRLTKKGGSK